MKRIALSLALAAAVAGCGDGPGWMLAPERSEGAGEAVSFRRLDDGARQFSAVVQRERLVIETPEAWASAWALLQGTLLPVPPVPAVDFTREAVVVVAMGRRPTAGYSIRVDRVERLAGETTVRVVETSPGRTCVLAQVLTSPFDVVLIPRSALPLRFTEQQAVRDC